MKKLSLLILPIVFLATSAFANPAQAASYTFVPGDQFIPGDEFFWFFPF